MLPLAWSVVWGSCLDYDRWIRSICSKVHWQCSSSFPVRKSKESPHCIFSPDGFPNMATLAATHSIELALSHACIHVIPASRYTRLLRHLRLILRPRHVWDMLYLFFLDTSLCRFVVNMLPNRPWFSVPVLPALTSGSQDSGYSFWRTCSVRWTRFAHKHLTPDPDHDCLSIRLCPHLPHIHTC